ncbi:bacterial Ig-like domain (Group 2) [Clostridium sp. CAG:122]|nr:bacterial Ig-like domain (Group 2) [Clostridium sp. CAG:122]
MRLKKGMRKALSLALSTALIITSANIGSTKSKAAEADDATHSYVATVEKNKLTKVTLDGKDVTDSQKVFNNGTADDGKFYVTDKENAKTVHGLGIDFSEVVSKTTGYTTPTITLAGTDDCNQYWYGGSVVTKFDGTESDTCGSWSYVGDGDSSKVIADAIKDSGSKFLLNIKDESGDTWSDVNYTVTVEYYDSSAKPTIDMSNVKDEITIHRGETIKISAPVTKPNSTRTIEFDGWAYDKTYTAIKGVKAWFDDETDEFYISASDDADMNADTPKIYMGTKTDIDGTTYKLSGGKDCALVVKEALATPTPTAEVSSAPAVSTEPSTAPTNGATTAPTSGATNTPAPVTSNTPAPTSDATPAPTEAPKGNMDKFNVAFNYVADDKWGEQSWGDKSVDVTGDGKYEISYTAQSDTTDIFMMILSTDLYKGSLNKDFKLVPTTVSVGKTDYKVNAKGGWCFADQEKTNAYRYNIVNPYNGPIGSDGVTYVDPAVTSIDGLGTVPVKKGDTIKVSFTVSGMKSSTSAKSKAKVTVSKKTVTVAAGKSTTVSYKALNKAGKAVKASAKTSNKKLATVKVTSSKKIKISVPKKAAKGSSAKITLTSAGKKATITVKVANPVKSAKAAKKTVKIKKGKKAKITVKVTAQNKKKATTDKLTAKSSKSKIAKITGKKVSKGKVTVTVKGAKKGTSKLTIKIGKKSVKVTVKVK